MNTNHISFVLVFLCLSLPQGAAAAETHRWVDKDGNVHYGDRPPDHTQTTIVDHNAARKAEQRAKQVYDPRLQLQRQLDESDVRNVEEREQKRLQQKKRVADERRQVYCGHLLAELKAHDNANAVVYLTDDQGERTYFTGAAREARRRELIAEMDKYDCR